MCTWKTTDKNSPNRMDALVWAVTELMSDESMTPSEVVYEDGVDHLF